MRYFCIATLIQYFFYRDVQGDASSYGPIAMIEFSGSLNLAGESNGHYICDVQEKQSKCWYRTNDNAHPKPLLQKDVSKNSYVILYKRCDN